MTATGQDTGSQVRGVTGHRAQGSQREGGDAQRGDDIESTALGELTGRHEGDGDWTGHRVTGQRGHRAQGSHVTGGRFRGHKGRFTSELQEK